MVQRSFRKYRFYLPLLGLLIAGASLAATAPAPVAPSLRFVDPGTLVSRMGNPPLLVESTNIANLEIAYLHVSDASALPLLGSDAPPAPGATEIYHATVPTGAALNETKTTSFDLKVLGPLQPGLYLADIKNPVRGGQPLEIRKWFTVSNLGIEAFFGMDGITAQVRLLSELTPAVNVEVALVAHNNRELGRTRTDAQGFAHFATSPADMPAALYAYGADGEFTALSLAGAEPHPAPSQLAWLIVKQPKTPEAPIKGFALLRDADGQAIANAKLRVQLVRADGGVAQEQIVKDQGGGGYPFELAVPNAPGPWRVVAYTGTNAQPVGQAPINPAAGNPPPPPAAPDIVIAPGRRSFPAGEPANVSVQPPFAGTVTLVVANNNVLSSQSVIATPDGAPVQLVIPAGEPAGVSILASSFTGKDRLGTGIGRAEGQAWLDVDHGAKRLGVQIEAPETATAANTLPITITLSNTDGQPAHLLILGQLDDAPALPDPVGFFLGRKPLQIGRADSYASLLGNSENLQGPVTGSEPPPVAPTLLWNAVIPTSADGKATGTILAPEKAGTIRLTVIAWSDGKLGAGQHSLTVTGGAEKTVAPGVKAVSPPVRPDMLLPGKTLTLPSPVTLTISSRPFAVHDKAAVMPAGLGIAQTDRDFIALIEAFLAPQANAVLLRNTWLLLDLQAGDMPVPADTMQRALQQVATLATGKLAPDEALLAHAILRRSGYEDALGFAAWHAQAAAPHSAVGYAALAVNGDAAAVKPALAAGGAPDQQMLALLLLSDSGAELPPAALKPLVQAAANPPAGIASLLPRMLAAKLAPTAYSVEIDKQASDLQGFTVKENIKGIVKNTSLVPLYFWATPATP